MSQEPESPDDAATSEPNGRFEALLEFLRRSRGFDFTGYKRSSLMRRVNKRMSSVGIGDYETYMDFLEVHPEEYGHLFDTILINVTAFFRDASAWEHLSSVVLPKLLESKGPDEPIRAWSAGCATGQEAYSIAMMMAEHLGIEATRDRVKIYATDVDEGALTIARHALYDERQVQDVPEEIRARYLDRLNGKYCVNKELRRSVIFGRHDLIQDAPISRIDLLACRNTLMYFNQETQARILDRFHFALNDRGILFLGKAETMLSYTSSFVALDLKRRIFAKVARNGGRERLGLHARSHNGVEGNEHLVAHVRLRETAFEAGAVAQVAVDFGGLLALANERARTLFGLSPADLGRPLQDLQLSYRPAELRGLIDRAYADRRPAVVREVEWTQAGGLAGYFDVHVAPLVDPNGALLGASISFVDVGDIRQLKDDLQTTRRELEAMTEEVQSTNEELETTNEELQSSVEELETTNEELQSTNEELETMNEELQSTNEEMETINEELRQRSEELKQVNAFLASILGSLRGGVIVIDVDFLIHVWNHKSEDLWGLRSEEVRGKNLLNLDIGLPVDRLRPAIRPVLAGEAPFREVALEATNRRGKPIRCDVTITPLVGNDGVTGAILLMEDREASDPGG